MATRRLTTLIEREGDGFVSLCPEVDVASQGDSEDSAVANLREALELYFEGAPPSAELSPAKVRTIEVRAAS